MRQPSDQEIEKLLHHPSMRRFASFLLGTGYGRMTLTWAQGLPQLGEAVVEMVHFGKGETEPPPNGKTE